MLKIEINNTAAATLPDRTIKKQFKKFLLARQIKNAEISLAFVDKKTMRRLNHSYRGLDQPTDVLSFSAQGGPASGWKIEDCRFGDFDKNQVEEIFKMLNSLKRYLK